MIEKFILKPGSKCRVRAKIDHDVTTFYAKPKNSKRGVYTLVFSDYEDVCRIELDIDNAKTASRLIEALKECRDTMRGKEPKKSTDTNSKKEQESE